MLEAATTRLSSHDTEGPPSLESLGKSGAFNAPSLTPSPSLHFESATITSLGDSTDPAVSKPRYPPSDSDDSISALNSFSLSLVSDNSVDDEFNASGSLGTLLSSSPPRSVTTTLQSSSKSVPHVSGLGISGLMSKDGSGPFDGLGIVFIKSSARTWRHLPSEIQRDDISDLSDSVQAFRRRPSSFSSSAYDGSLESEDFDPSLLVTDAQLSDVFLEEALLTFTEDPFHELCQSSVGSSSSSSIPDCGNNNSWSDLGLDTSSASASTSELAVDMTGTTFHSTNDSQPAPIVLNDRRRRVPKLNTNFSSATISSELKRSSTIIIPVKSTLRNRSSSWPCSTTEDMAATPLSRCRWRL